MVARAWPVHFIFIFRPFLWMVNFMKNMKERLLFGLKDYVKGMAIITGLTLILVGGCLLIASVGS